MILPRGIPSERMASSPLIPVLTRSGSGISSLHVSIVVGPWVSWLSTLQGLEHLQASLSRGCDPQEIRQPFAARVGSGENTHLRVARPVRHLRHEPCPNQETQRCIDLFEVVAQKVGDLLIGEQGVSMPGKEDQQIEIARVLEHADAVEETLGMVRFHLLWTRSLAATRPPRRRST